MSTCTEQAETFLKTYGIACRITLSNSKVAPWNEDGEDRNHYRVTLSKPAPKATQRAFDVLRNGKIIDTVFYSRSLRVSKEEVLRSLQEHDGVSCDAVRERRSVGARLVFDFWGSINDAKNGTAPSAYDVLTCISSDYYCADTFADWCSEFGDNEDSIKARQTWTRCHRFSKRLQAFFSPTEAAALAEIQ